MIEHNALMDIDNQTEDDNKSVLLINDANGEPHNSKSQYEMVNDVNIYCI